jgi:ElaB/YqjD/DUF883 family membrane-anchored ribosome-binding protein
MLTARLWSLRRNDKAAATFHSKSQEAQEDISMPNISDLNDPESQILEGKKTRSSATTADLSGKTSAALEEAKARASGLASDTAAKVRDFAEDQKNAGADAMKNAARAAQGMAESFEDRAPGVSQAARRAAQSVETAADSLQNTSVDEMGRSVAEFVRRQPLGALALGFFAGMLVARLFGARSS